MKFGGLRRTPGVVLEKRSIQIIMGMCQICVSQIFMIELLLQCKTHYLRITEAPMRILTACRRAAIRCFTNDNSAAVSLALLRE